MSNISRLAPYAYLAKRSGGGTMYDLLLLVPVDDNGDTDLSNVSAVKPGGSTRITIAYATTGSAANAPYRFKHFAIDSDGTYLDIEIKGDNDPDRTTLLAFSDADTEPAAVSNQQQTCAPYLFLRKETASSTSKYAHPSCIVLFDGSLGAQSESIEFAANGCTLTFTLGTSSPTTDPTLFAINQDIKAAIVANGEYSFEGNVAAYSAGSKPPRKNTRKVFW